MFKWLFRRKPVPATKRWIGNVKAVFVTPDKFHSNFWFQLYVGRPKGERTYDVTGRVPEHDSAKTHGIYSLVVYPWLNGEEPARVWVNLDQYDHDYWQDLGFVDRPQGKKDEEAKPGFKLLHFPKADEPPGAA